MAIVRKTVTVRRIDFVLEAMTSKPDLPVDEWLVTLAHPPREDYPDGHFCLGSIEVNQDGTYLAYCEQVKDCDRDDLEYTTYELDDALMALYHNSYPPVGDGWNDGQ